MQRPDTKATVVLLADERGRICLARKKQAIHHDKEKGGRDISYSLSTYNGYGGKKEDRDETILHTAIRELFDESSVVARIEDLELLGRVYFYVPDKEQGGHLPFMDVFFFAVREWSGSPREGKEMGPPEFFHEHEMPYDEMMPADKLFLEPFLKGDRAVYEVKLFGKSSPPEIRKLDEELAIA